MLGCPGNGLSVPRSQTAPRNASPVPRNRSDVPGNGKIVPGNILAPGNDPAVPGNAGTVPGNAENQNEQVSFSYWLAKSASVQTHSFKRSAPLPDSGPYHWPYQTHRG